MTLIQAIVLGVVQGLTEFLPISSSAHLWIVPAMMHWPDPGAAFTAVIQLGTLVAVLLYFWTDIWKIGLGTARATWAGSPFSVLESRLGWMIALATLPIVVCGLAFKSYIETTLRRGEVVAGAMIVLALFLIAAEYYARWRTIHHRELKGLDRVGWRDASLIGLAQALALIPGSSRSGVTITAGLFCGLNRETAARFSFLMSIPSVFAAAIYSLYKQRANLLASQDDALHLVVATVVSGVVGYASIAFLLGYLRRHTTWIFIVYRLALGVILLALLSAGYLTATVD